MRKVYTTLQDAHCSDSSHCATEECQDEFMAANGCERLVPFLGSADATVARKAASAIANLTEHSGTKLRNERRD